MRCALCFNDDPGVRLQDRLCSRCDCHIDRARQQGALEALADVRREIDLITVRTGDQNAYRKSLLARLDAQFAAAQEHHASFALRTFYEAKANMKRRAIEIVNKQLQDQWPDLRDIVVRDLEAL